MTAPTTRPEDVRGTPEYVARRQHAARQLSVLAQATLDLGDQASLFGDVDTDTDVCGDCHEVTENCWCPPF